MVFEIFELSSANIPIYKIYMSTNINMAIIIVYMSIISQ